MNYVVAVGSVLGSAAVGGEGVSLGFGVAAAVTLPIAAGLVAGGLTIGILVVYFSMRPTRENQTMRDIEAHLSRADLVTELGEKANDLEDIQTRLDAVSLLARRRQEALADEGKRKAKERTRELEKEDAERQREREEDRIRTEQQRKLEEEEERIVERERELQEWIEQARQRLEEEQETAASRVQPIRWPTEEEFRIAREKVQYDPLKFHFAIVGKAGSGKSSLINSFLNLDPIDDGAAPTGITETTQEIGRYQDPGAQLPRPWTVWFDVPGAGTQRVSHWQYFTTQALFVFDIIILTIGDRFEETDCEIVRSCIEFKIPFFIVRSKADQHIRNMMEEDSRYSGSFDSGEYYESCRQKFIAESKGMVSEELERASLPNKTVYCVSKRALRNAYNGSLKESTEVDDGSPEIALVKELMLAAYQRRCSSDNPSFPPAAGMQARAMGWARTAYTVAAKITESTIGSISHNPSKNRQPITNAKRVIYLPAPTTADQLMVELFEQNPGLSKILVGSPRMLNSKVAVLSFDSQASIPPRIMAFGKNQAPTMYKEKIPKTGRTSTRGGSVYRPVNTPPGSIGTPASSTTGTTETSQRRRRR